MPYTTDPNDITLNERTDLQTMLGNPPTWMMRFGVWAVLGFVVLLFTLGWIIKYPDIVEAKVILVTENPPIRVLARASGRIESLLVKNQQWVEKGDILAILDNTADWQDILQLEKLLDTDPLSINLSMKLKLGNVQPIYSTFSQNLKDYRYFTTNTGIETKTHDIESQITHLRALNDNLTNQKTIQEQEFKLAESELNRQKQLYTEGVISQSDLEKFTAIYLQQKRQIEATQANFINNAASIGQQQGQINDLYQNKNDNTNAKQMTLEEDCRRLRGAIAEWKQNYMFIAPIEGSITLERIWSAKQNISSGEELVTIVPNAQTSHIVAKATIPTSNSGKVTTGLTARIQLTNFPVRQYGMIEGKIEHIADVPQKEEYTLDISLPQSLTTTYGKSIIFRQEMQGTAKIITEDRRIISHLFDQFNDLLKNR